MNELIRKVEARLAQERDELETWGNTSRTISEIIKSDIKFLESLLQQMKALGQ